MILYNKSRHSEVGIQDDPMFNHTPSHPYLVTEKLAQVFVTINWVVLCTCLCCFGIVANSINVAVFARQGFQETVNLTLFALAISDLGSLITLLWMSICVNPLFQYADTALLTVEIQNVSGGWPHIIFVKITGWITTFVTFERCLCVMFPLKVKAILTPTRVKAILAFIYVFVIASIIPSMATARLGWKFVPERNRTMIGMIVTDLSKKIDGFAVALNGVISSLVILILTSLFTITLVLTIRHQSQWRKEAAADSGKAQKTESRDRRLIQMLIIIAVIFLICMSPVCAISLCMLYVPDFSVVGNYKNLFLLSCSFGLTLEAINSSVNIIIYYRMNTKYRNTFLSICCCGGGADSKRDGVATKPT